jgi:hypothetical protein
MKFVLTGSIGYDVGSCHDSRTVTIDEKIEAADEEQGVVEAKKLITDLHNRYKNNTDYGMRAELRHQPAPIWRIHFEDEVPAQKEVLAQPACPATPARLVETMVS